MKKENVVKKQHRHSRMSLSGIPTLDTQSGGDPRLQPSGMTNTINRRHAELVSASSRYDNNKTLKQVQGDGMRGQGDNSIKEEVLNKAPFRVPFRSGFTLIELLVVVLIIGILAAVAVPQYQKAVLKSRLAAIMPQVKALKQAREVYFMEHGDYGEEGRMNLSDLQISLQNDTNHIFRAFSELWFCDNTLPRLDVAGGTLVKGTIANIYGICLDHHPYRAKEVTHKGRAYCAAHQDNILANKVCLEMQGTLTMTGAPVWWGVTPTPYVNIYLLP